MKALLLTFWKPIAAILAALLGALGLYAKGRADAKAKRDQRDAKAATETFERAANAPRHTDAAVARNRMLNRDPDKR